VNAILFGGPTERSQVFGGPQVWLLQLAQLAIEKEYEGLKRNPSLDGFCENMDVGGIKFLPGDHDQFADQSLTPKKKWSSLWGFAPGAPNHPNPIQSIPIPTQRCIKRLHSP